MLNKKSYHHHIEVCILQLMTSAFLPLAFHTSTAGKHSECAHLLAFQQMMVQNASLAVAVQLLEERQLKSCEQTASSGTAVQCLSLQLLLQEHSPISHQSVDS